MTQPLNALQIAIWTIYGAVVLTAIALLTFGTQRLIRHIVNPYRDPIGPIDYGERHSDWDGE